MLSRSSSRALLAFACACASGCHPPRDAADARADSDSLVVGIGGDEAGLKLNRQRLGRYPLNAGICEPLLRLGRDFSVEPWLAKRWEYRGDNTYRFVLRSGPVFDNGARLGAASVKYTLEQGIKDRTQYSFLGDSSVTVVDDTTVDIRPARQNLRLPEQMVHLSYGIVAAGTDPSTRPVCTGPFRFREYKSRDHLSVDRNDSYWGEKAKSNRVTFRFIPDENTRALALRSGDVDLILDVNRSMVAALRATAGIKVVIAPPGAVIVMYIATRGAPGYSRMSDPALRRAIAMSIDRRALVSRIMEGYATEVSTINPPTVLGQFATMVHGVEYDPKLAKHLLDSVGWKQTGSSIRQKNGSRLNLSMIVQSGAVDRSVTQYVQAQLGAIGIELRIDELDAASYESRLNAGTFDLGTEVANQNDANPAFLLALRWYSKSNVRSAPFMVVGPRFDSLVDRALSGVNHVAAQKAAAEAMHVLVDEEVAAIALAGVSRIYAMSTRVTGFVPHPSRLNQSWASVRVTR